MAPIVIGKYTSIINGKEVEALGNVEIRQLEMPGQVGVLYKRNEKLYVRKQQEFLSKFKFKHETHQHTSA